MRTERTKELFLEAFEKCRGNASQAIKVLQANKVKIARRTYYNWCAVDPDFKKDVERIENAIDLSDIQDIEYSMRTLAKGKAKFDRNGEFKDWEIEPDVRAAKLYLEAKARKKGYGNSESTVTIKNDNRTEEQIQASIEQLKGEAQEGHYDIDKD